MVTFDALHTVRANLNWLVTDKKAHYIALAKKNQPLLHARARALPWRQVPAGAVTRDTGHGRTETRTLKAAYVSFLDFPGACQAIKITRRRKDTATGKTTRLLFLLLVELLLVVLAEDHAVEGMLQQMMARPVRDRCSTGGGSGGAMRSR